MSNLTRSGIFSARKHHVPTAWKLYEKMYIPGQMRPTYAFLLHARSKQFFFKTVEIFHHKGSLGFELVEKAYRLVHHEFRKHKRHSGEREAEHPTRMALIAMIVDGVRDPDEIVAILLHDIIEKFRNKWSRERIAELFNATVGELVWFLTKPVQRGELIKDEVLERFYRRQLRRGGERVLRLKSYDVFDNLITLWGRSLDRMERKIIDVEGNLLPLMHEFQVRFANDIERVLEYIQLSIENKRALNT